MASVALLVGVAVPAHADSNYSSADESAQTTFPYDGDLFITDSEPAPKETAVPNNGASGDGLVSPSCIVCGDVPVLKAKKVSGPVKVQKKFVKYLTGAWAKSSGYTWSASTTANATVSGSISMTAKGVATNIGVSASKTRTYSISVNISASSSKYSKLGLASDFNRYYVYQNWFNGSSGAELNSSNRKYGYLYSPTADQYLVVYYQ